jgi:2-oxo-4-hydroxy-4-carboxy-5-ureidoimidazoline decarboxylase
MNTHNYPLMLDDSQLMKICSSVKWHRLMRESMPFHDSTSVINSAQYAFSKLSEPDWLEAFSGHPMIGDMSSLQEKYRISESLSTSEQALVQLASNATLTELIQLNHDYLDKFGFIFIVCASGKSADEMLAMLKERIKRTKAEELAQAALEQQKISAIRMEAYL